MLLPASIPPQRAARGRRGCTALGDREARGVLCRGGRRQHHRDLEQGWCAPPDVSKAFEYEVSVVFESALVVLGF